MENRQVVALIIFVLIVDIKDKMIRFYLDIYIWRIKKFHLGIYHIQYGAIDIILGWINITIYYKPEENE